MKEDRLDFKLNYYYYKYRNTPLPTSDIFRTTFRKKNGKFPYINELILMINIYQVKKYGETLRSGKTIIKYRKDKQNGKYKKSEKTWYL